MASGVGNDDVETAQLRDSVRDQALAERFLTKISWDGDGFTACLANKIDHLACVRLFGWQVVDCHIRALPGVCDCGRAAHAGVTAGNQRFAVE